MRTIQFFGCLLALASAVFPLRAVTTSNILGIEGGSATSVGIYIREIKTGKEIVRHNAALSLTPASVTKALTTATALLSVGPDYTFDTAVRLTGDEHRDGCWNGNLVISSSGDPTLASKEFDRNCNMTDSIVAVLGRLGVKEIRGTIVIDQNLKDSGAIPQWECEDIAWSYGAGLYGFNYAGNCVRVYPNTGKTIPVSTLDVVCRPSTDGRTDQLRGIESNKLIVWGSAKNRADKSWNISTTNPDPAYTFTTILKAALKASGIKVGDESVNAKDTTDVYTYHSPLALDICRNLMKRSDNLFAEGMLRTLVPGGSRSDCLKFEKQFWNERNICFDNNIVRDGSGLTRANRISPVFLADMLTYMVKSSQADNYLDCFPVAGIDGTLKSFLSKTRLKGRLALKTGSVSSVQTYAGYKLDGNGKPTHVVVIMVNGFTCSRASLKDKIEKFLLKTFDNQ